MKTVQELLRDKGDTIFSVTPDSSVFDAITLMADKHIGSLIVMEGDRLVGIVTERDYLQKIILKGRASKDTAVSEIMTARVLCAAPNQTLDECMVMMTEKRARHLPVMDGDRVMGIISIGDLVKNIIAEQQFTIEQLEHYIYG